VAAGNAGAALAAAAALAGRDLDALAPRECVALAAWMDGDGHDIAAARLLRRCLVRRITPRERADLFLQLGLLRLGQGQAASAYQHLLDALDSDPSPETEATARVALGRIEVWHGRSRPGPGEGAS
jgi:hypothetical protein